MFRRDVVGERARLLKACIMPGEIYDKVQSGKVLTGVIVGLSRDGDEFTLSLTRAPGVLDAVDVGMIGEAFGVAEGSEPASSRKNGHVVTIWRWREALPVHIQ